MGRKPKERKYVKSTDGRKNNGRKRGEKVNKPIRKVMATPSAMNKAKKDRVNIYALNAMKEVFGSEEKAWESLAEKAKDSFPHLKLLFEYKYGNLTLPALSCLIFSCLLIQIPKLVIVSLIHNTFPTSNPTNYSARFSWKT